MKKTFRLVAVALVAVMLCLALASCGGPNADPEKAVEGLKDAGLVAAEDKLIVPTALKLAGVKGIDTVVGGAGKIDDEYAVITVIYFDEAEDAKNAMEAVEKYADDNKSKDAKDSEWEFKQSGKMIWYGTKNAVKAAK